MRDVVGLYLASPERAVVLGADEGSQSQALDRPARSLPTLPGTPARANHDHRRVGTSSLDTRGRTTGKPRARRRGSPAR
ncbi:MAG: hypothetical protein K2X91_10770 [Thermoleophilia bacterium]|nr:hypothetical protein [Thermoleophilia bacterium]